MPAIAQPPESEVPGVEVPPLLVGFVGLDPLLLPPPAGPPVGPVYGGDDVIFGAGQSNVS